MGRDITFGARYNSDKPKMTQWEKSRIGRSQQSFKGSTLVSTLIEQNPYRFKNRPDALKFARLLFREGTVKSIYETSTFEDSGQLYAWNENDNTKNSRQRNAPQTPLKYGNVGYHTSNQNRVIYAEADDRNIIDAAKQKLRNKRGNNSVVKKFFKDLESEFSETKCSQNTFSNQNHLTASAWLNQRPTSSSNVTSVENRGYRKFRERPYTRITTSMAMASQHDIIPEEEPSLDVTAEGNSLELELAPRLNDQLNRRWHDSHSYSDNEKQLMEEMDKMKDDHKETLKNYEERIEKLMTKMHELRGIAETLESSGNKTYGLLPTRTSLLNFFDAKLEDGKKTMSMTFGPSLEMPPPLPPRPGRSSNVCPSKPVINPKVKMKSLDWSRLILKDVVEQNQTTIWHTMKEPKLDPDEVERLFQSSDLTTGEGGSLYDDMAKLRGKTKQQLVTLLDVEKSRRAVYTMKCLPCTMNDVINAVSSLDTSQINSDRFAELLELLGGGNEIERVQFHVRRKSPASLDYPEYLLLELTKINHCKERMDFMRFRHRIQWHLFETEQQLKEVHTACDEVTNSLPLKNLMETLLATGNYLNGGSMSGQADGFCIEIINKLKEIQDRDGKGHLLEFVLKLYCQYYEVEVELGCPTKFKLPEPSNMRHAAQVSFDNIQEALSNMKAEVKSTREKFLTLAAKENNDTPDSLWSAAENFITNSLEMIGEEEKLLHNTRVLFRKTTSYFLYDVNQNNPQPFFQLWAVFLHDCKYFWKLAHRKIGKERFEIDFKHRGQLPSTYSSGNEHYRANMHRLTNTLDSKPTPSISSKALHSWMESLGDVDSRPDVPPLPQQEITKTQLDALQNSPSPKMLTNEPPVSSSVHKPLPKTPAISVKNENDVSKLPHNYENQEDIERNITEPSSENQSGTEHHTLDGTAKKSDKYPPFSFKWLKRDPTNRNNSGDSRSSADSNRPDMDGTKRQTSQGVTPFTKFKNSMAQKFSSGNNVSQKRNIDSVDESHESAQEQPILPTRHVPSFTPLKVTISENEINPYETSLGREQRAQIAALAEAHRYVRDNRTSSAERRSQFDVGHGKIRNASVVSTEYAGLYHTPPFSTNNIDKDGYSNPHILRAFATKSDINNNTPQYPGQNLIPEKTEGVRRNRAPIALGSNLSISDAYSRPGDHLPQRPSESDQSTTGIAHSVPESSNTFHQTPISVPSYNAKRVHNYENQGRFDNLPGTRYRADPVSLPTNLMPVSTQNNPFSSLNQTQSTNISKYTPNILMKETNLKVSDPGTANTHDVNMPNGDVRKDISVPPKPSRNMQLNFHDPKRDHKFSPMGDKQGQKGPPSIATLINQFEKKQNLLEANSSDNIDRQTIDNKVAVTSTPVTHQGLIGTHDEPPPVPPRADQSFQDHYPSDSLESRSSRGTGRKLLNGFDGGYNSNTSQKSSPVVDQHYRNPVTGVSAPPKAIHTRQETGLSDQDDSYKDRLRKANSSFFDRYTKQLAASSYNKQTNSLQFSTPQYSRQSSSNQTTTNSLPYSRQNSNQPNSQPTRQNGLVVQPPVKPPKQMPFVRNLFGNERDQQDLTSRPSQSYHQHAEDGNDDFDGNHLRNSPLAVVKPTVVNRGSVTFMEI